MGSEYRPLRSSGIYRSLPTFDPAIRDLKAIVVGATGISGFNTIRALLDTDHRWSTIYAISRSPPSEDMLGLLRNKQRSRIKHVSIDLTGSADTIATQLREGDVQADYVFFYGYISPQGISALSRDAEEQMREANVPIFEHFLAALPLADIRPRRILLQTGAKNYGGQIGRARTPCLESDPQPRHLSKNFYYPQEDLLKNYCDMNPECGWNVIRPWGVIGAVPKTGMTPFLPHAIIASVCAKKNEPLVFGSDIQAWQNEFNASSAILTGYLSEWAVLEEKCRNQAFNSQDGTLITWDRIFEELARWYRVEKGVVGPELDQNKFKTVVFAGGDDCPLGYGPPTSIRLSHTLKSWVQDESNTQAWKEMVEESKGALKDDIFGSGGVDFSVTEYMYCEFGMASMAKVRRFGFNGFVDTMESIFEMCTEMAQMKLMPRPKVLRARPQV